MRFKKINYPFIACIEDTFGIKKILNHPGKPDSEVETEMAEAIQHARDHT